LIFALQAGRREQCRPNTEGGREHGFISEATVVSVQGLGWLGAAFKECKGFTAEGRSPLAGDPANDAS
jgi:hypothetical protein